ncbi:MAG: hypothetical protein J0M12_14510 [Deltaproteobacteria bacterium]|nr:hypothetical protein [Deltaproteobacteria bacterium]
MVYFQEQLQACSTSPNRYEQFPDARPIERPTAELPHAGFTRQHAPIPMGGIALAVSLGSMALLQSASSAAGSAPPAMLNALAHTVPHMVISSLAEHAQQRGFPELDGMPRRHSSTKSTPEDAIEEAMLTVEMHLAGGNISEALSAAVEAVDLIEEQVEIVSVERFAEFCLIAQDLLETACAQELSVAQLNQALKIANLIEAQDFRDLIESLISMHASPKW